MVLFRWFVGLPIAAAITLGLFAMMAGLIKMDKGPLAEPKDSPDIQITARLKDRDPRPDPPRPPQLLDNPPEIDIPRTLPGDKPGPIFDLPGAGKFEIDPGDTGGPVGAPVIRVAPLYPENCRARGAAGHVVVQFDVTPEGGVTNVQIIESPDRCFDRPVRRAVSKWKYPPRYDNGRPVMRYGVVEVFNFELTG